uniref:DMT family transporter n=1 Tax=Candidatus Planktophila sp. TaxID=2175601 RepID=UPI00404A73C6
MLDRFRGEIYLILGALFFSFNGVISTLVLDHMSPFRLVQIRCIGAFTILFLFIVVRNRNSLRATRQEIPTLILFGVIGFAVVQAGYFLGIRRGVPLSLVLIIEFTAPIWIVLWIKFVRKRDVPNAMWGGIALSFLGLFFIAKVWDGLIFDLIGIIGALISAFALAVYFLVGSQVGQTQSAQSMTAWGLGIATMAWTLVMPIWQFPFEIFSKSMNLQGVFDGTFLPGWVLIVWIIVMGTIVPYLFVIGGLRRMAPSTASVVGMLEPVLAGAFAWIWLAQSWALIQLSGAAIVLVGIYIADSAKIAATKAT